MQRANVYSASLLAEFCDDSEPSLYGDSDILSGSFSSFYDDDILEEIDNLMECNARVEKALMKVATIFEDPAETAETSMLVEATATATRRELSKESRSKRYLDSKASQTAGVSIGCPERRRSIGGTAA